MNEIGLDSQRPAARGKHRSHGGSPAAGRSPGMTVLVGLVRVLVAALVLVVRLLILATVLIVRLVRQSLEARGDARLRRVAMQAAWEAQLPVWDAYLDELLDYLAHHPKAEGLATRTTPMISPSGPSAASS